jgi:tetratricopeptide (TPR) repeat protein
MVKEKSKWLIRSPKEGAQGPFSTEEIVKKIKINVLSGEEEIASYPDGDWVSLSKQIEFYDALIEALENPLTTGDPEHKKMLAETIIQFRQGLNPGTRPKPKPIKEISNESDLGNAFDLPDIPQPNTELKKGMRSLVRHEKKSQKENKKKLWQKALAPSDLKKSGINSPAHLGPSSHGPNDFSHFQNAPLNPSIELKNIEAIKGKERKRLWFYFTISIFVLIAGLLYLSPDTKQKKPGWSLIVPSRGKITLTDAEVKRLKVSALSKIRTGEVEDLLDAQLYLVAIAESGPKDLESLGLLCSVQYLLWPYTEQSTLDLKAVTQANQIIRSANPISSYSDACQAIFLWVKGQPNDARGVLEKTLDQTLEQRFVVYPFLYVMKADMLEDSQNYMNAEAYYREAYKTFPEWLWPQFGLGRTLLKQGKSNEARTTFENMLKQARDSKAALYGYAMAEVSEKRDLGKALNYFSAAFLIQRKLPRAFHVEALTEFAKMLLVKGDKAKALEVVERGLDLSPSNKTLREYLINLGGQEKELGKNGAAELVLLGDQFNRNGDYLAAQAQFKAAFDLDPTNANIALKTAKSLWELNQAREAHVWLDKAIKIDRKLLSAYALKADYYSQKYNFVDAHRILSEASRNAPNNFDILKAQAQVEYRKKNMSGSSLFAEKAMKIYDSDVELLTLLANININIVLNSPSRTEEEQERSRKAMELAKKYSGKAVDLEPGWPEAQLTFARFILAEQNSTRSENYLKELIRNFPYSIDYRLGLAEFYEAQEQFKLAIEIYMQVGSSDEKNKKAQMGLARSYHALNEYNKAKTHYLEAAVIDPSDVEPLFATAQLELESATGAKAELTIRKALVKFKTVKEINPNYPRVSYFLARCFYELGLFAEAVEAVKDEKAKNPNLADPYLLAAEIFDKKGQFKDCAAEYSQALRLRSNSADLFIKTASCYRKSESLDIAQDMVDMAVSRERGFPGIYKEQGYINEKKGMLKEAKKSFELYLELSPNALDRKEIQSKISELDR